MWAAIKRAGGRCELDGWDHIRVTGPLGTCSVPSKYTAPGTLKGAAKKVRLLTGLDLIGEGKLSVRGGRA